MKKKLLTELRAKTIDEIEKVVVDTRVALEKMKLEGVNGKEMNKVGIKNTKRELAQLLTILTEKKGVNA